jgi:hypothetical protein
LIEMSRPLLPAPTNPQPTPRRHPQPTQSFASKRAKGQSASIKFFPDMTHGYALRGNMSDPAFKAAASSAFDQGLAFLKKELLPAGAMMTNGTAGMMTNATGAMMANATAAPMATVTALPANMRAIGRRLLKSWYMW